MDYEKAIQTLDGYFVGRGMKHSDALRIAKLMKETKERAEAAEDENKKLRDIMVQIRKSDCMEKCSVVFEMTYSEAISSEQLGDVAGYVFRGLMKADHDRRNKNGLQGIG